MLAKLQIKAFRDEFLREFVKTYALQINPEKVTRSFGATYKRPRGINAAGVVPTFAGIAGTELHLEFFVDSTGAVPGVTSVPDAIQALKDTTHSFDGKIHSPYFLQVLWGDLDYSCRLRNLGVEYTLFSPSGIPLRARVTADFTGHVPPAKLASDTKRSSPDLTHARIVQAGETLPLLCEEIYREDRVYPQVARYNDLDNLVMLAPGTRISLPPLRD